MYFTIYQIINNLNNKIYIGMHLTNNLDDGYMGSGVAITRAIKKYGIENFTKEILHIVNTKEEMITLEEAIVDQDFIDRRDNYNIHLGGQGGFSNEERAKGATKIKWLRENDPEWVKKDSATRSKVQRTSYENGRIGTFKGKQHIPETIAKMKKAHTNNNHQQGEDNSQHGTMWIYNLDLKLNKKISKGDIIPDGWLKGRKMKF